MLCGELMKMFEATACMTITKARRLKIASTICAYAEVPATIRPKRFNEPHLLYFMASFGI